MKDFIADFKWYLVSSVMIAIAFIPGISDTAALVIFILAAFLSGYEVVIDCYKNVLTGNIFDENTLIFIASVVAFVLGEYFEGAFIVVLFGIGETLEDVASDRARDRISALSEFKEIKVRLSDGEEAEPETVDIGTVIEVLKGERIAIDGELLSDFAELDLKAITGESRIYETAKGDNVYSGAINLGNAILIKTTKLFKDSTVESIVSMVEGANSKKAKSQKFITKFAKIYTPVIVFVAVLIAFLPTLLFGKDLSEFVYKALSFLIVSCPCALVISVPLGYFLGIGALSKRGVLIKGGQVFDEIDRVKAVAFDKTGTLTKGELSVSKVVCRGDSGKDELIRIAASVEKHSDHPIGRAIVKYAGDIPLLPVSDIEEHGGKGVSCTVNGNEVKIGTASFVGLKQTNPNDTCAFVLIDGKPVGEIYFEDELKENAKGSIEKLYKSGVGRIAVVSGDTPSAAEKVAGEIGVKEFYGGLLPEQKVSVLDKIKSETKGNIAFVGDGENDSPCIAKADVGIAMGSIGSEISVETADAVILNDDLSNIYIMKRHARKVKRIVITNIIFSIAVKVAIMTLALAADLPVFVSITGDVGVMLLAVFNSLRAGRLSKRT
ncbi:MAG: cadmium-translocating P-type ATPase [Clostridia bacterium]|nr:cadmium-translocating P-type ATPase [Clostridia bacterium]